jgi:hypothetical protein
MNRAQSSTVRGSLEHRPQSGWLGVFLTAFVRKSRSRGIPYDNGDISLLSIVMIEQRRLWLKQVEIYKEDGRALTNER